MEKRFWVILLSLFVAWSASAAPGAGQAFFTDYTSASFRKLPAANQPMDAERVDITLLDAAVFHETNQRRVAQKLPPLRFDSKARQAAAIQSRAMAKNEVVSHENPDPKMNSAADRARSAGLERPALLAANVASAFGRRHGSGQKFYVREQNGRKVYSAEPNGPSIPMHTYLSFASALLDSWMNSPGHRQNILGKDAEYLGCSCIHGEERSPLETYYCTQVFYRALR